MKEICFCLASSRVTWRRLPQMALNPAFMAVRARLRLAVIFNGELSDEIRQYLEQLQPDHLIVRENTGNEAGAYQTALERLPSYDWYFLMHDDHWFWSGHWLEVIMICRDKGDLNCCYGNLVRCAFPWREELNQLTGGWGFSSPARIINVAIMQGMAGLYSRQVLELFLARGGIPYFEENSERYTHFLERLFSYILIEEGVKLQQLAGGFEYLLLHRNYALNPANSQGFERLPAPVQDYIRKLSP